MELDVKAERTRMEAELKELNLQLSELDGRRQEIVNRLVGLQAVLSYLERLDQHREERRK